MLKSWPPCTQSEASSRHIRAIFCCRRAVRHRRNVDCCSRFKFIVPSSRSVRRSSLRHRKREHPSDKQVQVVHKHVAPMPHVSSLPPSTEAYIARHLVHKPSHPTLLLFLSFPLSLRYSSVLLSAPCGWLRLAEWVSRRTAGRLARRPNRCKRARSATSSSSSSIAAQRSKCILASTCTIKSLSTRRMRV